MNIPMNNDQSVEQDSSYDQDDAFARTAIAIVTHYQYYMPFMSEFTQQNERGSGPYKFSLSPVALGFGFAAVRLPSQNRHLLSLLENDEELPEETFKRRMANLAKYTCTLTPVSLRITNAQGGVSCEVSLPLVEKASDIPVDGLSFKIDQERLELVFLNDKALLHKFKAGTLRKEDWLKDVGQFSYDPKRGILTVKPDIQTQIDLSVVPDVVNAPLRKASECAGAIQIPAKALGQSITYAGIFSPKDREGDLVSGISVENGSARGGDTNRVSIYEDPNLLCPAIAISAKQGESIRSVLRRCGTPVFIATVGKSVVFGDGTIQCEFEQAWRAFPPISKTVEDLIDFSCRLMLDQSDLQYLKILTMTAARDPIAHFSVAESEGGHQLEFKIETYDCKASVPVNVTASSSGPEIPVGLEGGIRVNDLIKMYGLSQGRPLSLYLSDKLGMMESTADDFVSRQIFAYPKSPGKRSIAEPPERPEQEPAPEVGEFSDDYIAVVELANSAATDGVDKQGQRNEQEIVGSPGGSGNVEMPRSTDLPS